MNTLRLRQNYRHFSGNIFKCIFLNENIQISFKIPLKYIQINNITALVQIMAWHRPGKKPLSEPMVVKLLTHICVYWCIYLSLSLNELTHFLSTDTMWQNRLGSTLAHYLNQCWLTIKGVPWHSPEGIFCFIRSTHELNLWHVFEHYTFEITTTSPSGQWVKVKHLTEVTCTWFIARNANVSKMTYIIKCATSKKLFENISFVILRRDRHA